ncbi:MAG: class I SAM-dependent methyltransferase [Candidatus Protochlamydia sp.]|nr:class I SAM-dependent methyltransferase [Candidatus Protochlamydia sp.]
MRSEFSLFQSHLDLAHNYWRKILCPGQLAIDATCGNGHDTLQLCQLALVGSPGRVYAFDRLEEAIEKTKQRLTAALLPEQLLHVHLEARCHSQFPSHILPESIQLIVYNLGYLPGGNKELTTCKETTLKSLEQGLLLISPGGAISLTCYPGHPEGALEEKELQGFLQKLSPLEWSACQHIWLNRRLAPSLLILQKAKSNKS